MSENTIRILGVGDQHNDTVAPSSRKDDYCQAIKDKLLEIKALAHEKPTNAIIFSGDLINKQDSYRVPYSLTNWLIDYFANLGVDTFLAMGNHDVKARSEQWERQPIGSIVKSGAVTPLWTNPTVNNPTGYVVHYVRSGIHRDKLPVRIHGRLFSYLADKSEHRQSFYSIEKDASLFEICAVHAELIPNGEKQLFDFTTPELIDAVVSPDRRPDVYFSGHVHDNLGVFGGSGYRCVNFGAISRGSIDEYNLTRPVQIAEILITPKSAGKFELFINPIVLKCAKPAADVFYVQELQKKRVKQADLVFLSEMLKAENLREVFKLVNPDDAINFIMQNQHVEGPVELKVRDYLAKAKEELGY